MLVRSARLARSEDSPVYVTDSRRLRAAAASSCRRFSAWASLARASPSHPQPSHEAPSPKLVHALSADAEWRFRFYVAPRINLGWNLEAFSFTVLQTCTALVSSRLLPFHCLLQVLLFLLSASSHFRRAPHKPCSLHPTHAATNSNHPNPNRHLGLSDHSNFSAPSGPRRRACRVRRLCQAPCRPHRPGHGAIANPTPAQRDYLMLAKPVTSHDVYYPDIKCAPISLSHCQQTARWPGPEAPRVLHEREA